MDESYWLSTEKMTVIVHCRNEVIIYTSPIIRKFKGQKFVALINWLERQGGLLVHKLENIIDVERTPKCIDKKDTG